MELLSGAAFGIGLVAVVTIIAIVLIVLRFLKPLGWLMLIVAVLIGGYLFT